MISLTPWTFLSYMIDLAMQRGMAPNLIVFLLLFPVLASIIAFVRHVIGLTGFSIYAPAALAAVLLFTGITQGMFLFLLMLFIASVGKSLIKYFHIEYVPRTAMLIWFVAIGMLLSLIAATLLPLPFALHIDIFPLLLLVLLAEDFMGMQSELKWNVLLSRSIQIMSLSVLGALIMGNKNIQDFALAHSEILVVGVAVATFVIGRYLGLRLTEYFRFSSLLDQEE